ncbi:MAG: FAD-dependent oxidoreductase [Bacteroidales bacterium]|jgi:heterodisulfide reductase subunit A|nr:FAD-dependent oxidoreductase [Bacteroidales bacterium]
MHKADKKRVVVIGGGAAGLEAAGQLARAGCIVTLLEKESETGGHVKNWYHLFPDIRNSDEVLKYLVRQADHGNITVRTGVTAGSLEKNGKSVIVKTSRGERIISDAVVLATGFDLFDSRRKEEYGYDIYHNVISSADLEVMFREGSVKRHDGEIPQRIGFVHCVGSRDSKVNNLYCSKLCCVTAVKQAMEIKKHIENARVYCFYMDMRMGGALYEELYKESQESYGIVYIRGKVSEVSDNIDSRLIVKVEDTLAGRPLRMELDMLVLMAGMEMSESGMRLAESSDLQTAENRFFAPADHHFGSNRSNMDGVFYAGTCTAPMNITDTISHARAVVADVTDYFRNINA